MNHSDESIQAAVKSRYASAALSVTASGASCCGPGIGVGEGFGAQFYDVDQTGELPAQASLGCGNPTTLATLSAGQVVLDLGSGGGIDVLLSARRVGPTGHVYGLDMTPEMIALAQRNQAEAGVANAEFLLGSIEEIPLPDASVDVVISNCVINLAANKDVVLAEAFRVLRPGGLFAVSDVVLLRELPTALRGIVELWTGCIAGALVVDDYHAKLRAAGFTDTDITPTLVHDAAALRQLSGSITPPDDMSLDQVLHEYDNAVANAFIRARRP